MNKKILASSILIVLMLIILPTTTAIHQKTGSYQITQLPEFKDIQQMNINEIIEYTLKLADGKPEIQAEINRQIKDLENDEILQQNLEEIADNNQTLIQKIWNQVINYRFFRLYISFWITLYTQSKISLLRTINWAIKTLKWIQVGLILGVIDIPDYTPPETPTITFTRDTENNTLTVAAISTDNILWNNIDQIGSGTTDPLPTGNITIGDMITNCIGIIVLRYKPTDEVLGIFEFE